MGKAPIVGARTEATKAGYDNNVVDPLMKPMTQQKHDHHTRSIGISYMGDWI